MTVSLIPLRLETGTVALVPGHCISWHRVQLPRGVLPRTLAADPMGPRLRSVLEGLLEEHLLEEPSTLHMALQAQPQADAPVWVAVCDHETLARGMQQLAAQGHIAQRLVPEWAPGRGEDASALWLTGNPDAPVAHWCDDEGVHAWPLPPQQQHASSWPTAVLRQRDRGGPVYADPALAAWAEQALERPVSVLSTHERLEQTARTSTWNLAQGRLSLHQPWPVRLRQTLAQLWQDPAWRPARWAASLLVLVQLVALNAAAWQAKRQEAQLKTAIASTLTSTFPSVQVVVDAPVQMQRAVAALQQGSGAPTPRDLDAMLQALQQNMPPAQAGKAPTAINFEAGQLRLVGLAWTESDLQPLQQGLRSQGLQLRRDGDDWVLNTQGTP